MMKATGLALCIGVVLQPALAKSAFETYGDFAQFAIPAFAFGLTWHNDDIEGMAQIGYSLSATTATVFLLKNTVDATRPDGSPQSFPSGHTAWAFSGASYLQMRYGWGYGLPAYIAAAAVGWSRVDADQHYWRDVIASAVIATGYSYVFTTPYKPQFAISPTIMRDGAQGIAFNYRF